MSLPVLKRYQRADYGQPAPRVRGVKRTTPDKRGWGSGWPNPQMARLVYVTVKRPRDGQAFTVRVREEVRDLVGYLLAASFALGEPHKWELRKKDEWSTRPNGTTVRQGGVGSFSNRAIKGSNPPQPSWHSWGLALDLNSRSNPMRRTAGFSSTQLPAVIDLWESAGFHWGGRWNASDAMHVEKLFRPEDTAADLANARRAFERLRPPPPEPKPEEMTVEQTKAVQAAMNALGWTPRLVEDGIYGPLTNAAVEGIAAKVAQEKAEQRAAVERLSEVQVKARTHVNAAKATLEEG